MQKNEQSSPITTTDINVLTAKLNESTYFAFISLLASLLAIIILIIISENWLISYFEIPIYFLTFEFKVVLLGLVGLTFSFDLQRYFKRKQKARILFELYNKQLNAIWESKKKQQQKANTFSDHTEKLKLFISDKLLEHIEYDEKFLHFKGIAAEIRHNGVISYDKVVTALEKAMQQQHFLSLYEQENNDSADSADSSHNLTIDALANYQNAIDAMRYLWDLLDLSTADNMALHIGNRLIDCEEHYYQLNLDNDKQLDSTLSIPVLPTFQPQLAALMTLSMLTGEAEIRNLISLSKINHSILLEPFTFENSQFRIQLLPCPELLGNPNHIILLLENLLKNAQFFSQKNTLKQKTDRINLKLQAFDGFIRFSIYNRGPQIEPADIPQIFKLGYSTRRKKQHNGKGLGLFFCQEIVEGYQGKIGVKNIDTPMQNYQLKLHLTNGEIREHLIEVGEVDGIVCASIASVALYLKEITIESDIPISSIEVLSGATKLQSTPFVCSISLESADEWVEPDAENRPKWIIVTQPFKKIHKLSFKPLDIQGVQFEVNFPTAESHLNESFLDFGQF